MRKLVKQQKRALILTPGDIEVLRWLWMSRVMTVEQIRRLRYFDEERGLHSHRDNVRKRLKRLWDDGYLMGDTLLDTKERIYMLGKNALAVLRDYCDLQQQRLYRSRFESLIQLRHPLLVSECLVRVVECVRDTPMALMPLAPFELPFYHTHVVADPTARTHVERFLTQEDIAVPGIADPFRIRPDLVFALASGERGRLFFLEADRGHEGSGKILDKQLGYHHYATRKDARAPERWLWQRYAPVADFRVLFVTTNQRRIVQLEQMLSGQPGFERILFTTAEAFKSQHVLYDSIWRAEGQSPRPLLKAPSR